jgi:hypothetical protein
MNLRISQLSAMAISTIAFMLVTSCSSGDPSEGSTVVEQSSELKPRRACAARGQCRAGEYCTTEVGVCNRPACRPGMACITLCYGTCESLPADAEFCGGIAGFACPERLQCIDDPRDDCDPTNGGADCGGACVEPPIFCGGIAGLPCPKGHRCVDNPNDSCDPRAGGADCGGICVKPTKCTYTDPKKQYVARSPERCAAIHFLCAPDYAPFFDSCGCGCQLATE